MLTCAASNLPFLRRKHLFSDVSDYDVHLLLLVMLQARCGEVDAETAALLARREQLSAVVAATPQPARSRQAAAKLRSAAHKLELLAGLQVRVLARC
jgi:hypothetical protein